MELSVFSIAAGFLLPRLVPWRSAHVGMPPGERNDIGNCWEKPLPMFLNLGGLLVGKGLSLLVSLGTGSGDLAPGEGAL